MKQLHIILHTTQVTQVASLLEVQTKIIIDIDYDHLGPNVAIVPCDEQWLLLDTKGILNIMSLLNVISMEETFSIVISL